MNGRNFLISGIVLLGLLAVLSLTNAYVIGPKLTPRLPEPDKLPPAKVYTSLVDKSSVATTMEKIRDMYPQKKSFEPRLVWRNPFLWPEEMLAVQKAVQKSESMITEAELKRKGKHRLSMIILGENRKIALLNNIFVFEGSRFNNTIVQKIDKKGITLKGPAGKIRVSLSKFSFTPLQRREVSIPKATSPRMPSQEQMLKDIKQLMREGVR